MPDQITTPEELDAMPVGSVAAVDRAAVIEAAAKAAFMVGHIGGDTWEKTDRKSREYRRDQAAAALPVIVAAVLKPIRELHASGEPVCVETGHTPSRCPCSEVFCEGCGESMPCPTVRLLDEIESSAKGGE